MVDSRRSPPSSGVARLFVVVSLLLIGLAVVFVLDLVGPAERQPPKSRAGLQSERGAPARDLNLPLLSQQLDMTFQELRERFFEEGDLPPEDRKLLQNWLQFDERFVEQNQGRDSLKYERVVAHRRLGFGLHLLQQPLLAISHYQSAIELLDRLAAENPTISNYRTEQAVAFHELGRAYESARQEQQARRALDSAIETLRESRDPTDQEQQQLLDELYQYRRQFLAPN
jgi:tetratricopeptide (TPR) repeat protein